MKTNTLLSFPCDFPIKVMGVANDEFILDVKAIIAKHAPDTDEDAFRTRDSKHGKYCSLTVTVQATSQEMIDNIYQDLTCCQRVLMAL